MILINRSMHSNFIPHLIPDLYPLIVFFLEFLYEITNDKIKLYISSNVVKNLNGNPIYSSTVNIKLDIKILIIYIFSNLFFLIKDFKCIT